MKFRTSMICVVVLVCGLQMYGQQADSATHMTRYQCLGRPGHPPGIMNRNCKPGFGGTQTVQIAQPSNDLPRNDDSGTFITFDVPGARSIHPISINVEGTITGYYFDANSLGHGFLRARNGAITVFDVPGGTTAETYPLGINVEGTVTGYYIDDAFNFRGFVRTVRGIYTTFNVPGDFGDTEPLSISPLGTTTGIWYDSHFVGHGFLRTHFGAITTFDVPGLIDDSFTYGIINPEGAVTGNYLDTKFVKHGFLRSPDGALNTLYVPGACQAYNLSYASGINPAGLIVGGYLAADCVTGRGFLRTRDGAFTTFDVPGATGYGSSGGINPEGAVTGDFFDGGQVRGFLRSPNGTFTKFDAPPGSQSIAPGPIDAAGVVTGFYEDANGVRHGFVWTKH